MTSTNEMLYPYTFRYKNQSKTLLWGACDGGDCFYCMDNGSLYQASDIQDAKFKFEGLISNIVWDEGATVDFDLFWNELENLNEEKSLNEDQCETILNCWNFIEDLLRTYNADNLKRLLKNDLLSKAYDKLFYGNNMEAVTPEGKSYSPLWTKAEITELNSVFTIVWNELGDKSGLWEQR